MRNPMKTLFVAASVFALIAAPAALAQEEHHPGPAGGAQQHAPAGPPARQGPAPQGPVGHPAGGGGMGARGAQGPGPAEGAGPIRGSRVTQNVQPLAGARPEVAGHTGGRQAGPGERGQNDRGAGEKGANDRAPNARGGPQHTGAGPVRAGAINAQPGARGGARGAAARSPAVAALRRNVQASHRFHVGAYQAPAGYRARHWSHGQRLPGFLFARNYWLLNYAAYALFPPPPGLVWVRVGADALLIDQFTGEIIQVDYGVFY